MALSTTRGTQRRILALWLARLPIDRLTRVRPFAAPLAVAARAGNALHVHALCPRAARLGLYRGQPLANARAMVEGLCVLPVDESADRALLAHIADWCDRFTPFVTAEPPDGLLLDITGAAHLFGGERAMLTHIRARLTALGFAVEGAVAGTSLAARALARHRADTIAAPGDEAAALASLPVAALSDDTKILRALRRAGLLTIGQVATRGRSELASRLGADFVTRLGILLGAEEKPLSPRRPLPDLMAERRFAEPVSARDFIATSLHDLARALCAILEREGRGARHLEASFFRADGAVRRIAVRTGAPSHNPDAMLRLLRQRLDGLADPLDPGFGFDLIRLEARLAQETHPVTLSFDSQANAKAQIGFLIDRLAARFGETRVQRFAPQDTHIPEATAIAVPAQEHDFDGAWSVRRSAGDPPLRPLRLFEKPEEISAVAAVPDGPPLRFRWRRGVHEVTHAEGPERIALEWWREKPGERLVPGPQESDAQRRRREAAPPPTRDYFRVETRGGGRFWLYRDGLYRGPAPRWYLQGIFA